MKRKRVVHVFSTFDTGRDECFDWWPLNTDSASLDKVCHTRAFQTKTLLPNWVGPAKKTLLAQLAKSGLITKLDDHMLGWSDHGAMLVRNLKDEAGRGEGNAATRRRPHGADRLKVIDALKGKLIGVEVEFYPDDPGRSARENRHEFADVVTDGSLHNEGREVRRISWVQDNRIRGIANMVLRGQVSSKCGLHVHVDVRDLEGDRIEQVRGRIASCVPFLKWMVPKRRRGGYQYVQWDGDGHYGAFNHAEHHGTIEFRMQVATLNGKFIEKWALFCYHLTRRLVRHEAPNSWPKFVAMFPTHMQEWILRVSVYMENLQTFGDPSVNARIDDIVPDEEFDDDHRRDHDDDDDDDDGDED